MPTRAAIYARYSSDEQTGGESIEYQLERCKEHIQQQGWRLDEANVFIDRARSGTTTYRRDEFNRMVASAKAQDRPFDVVVCWSTSRFGRDQDEAIFNKISLRKQGVEVKFVSQPVPEGHIGTLIERIYEWKDEFDSIQIGEYAFQGQKQVTQKGYHGGGKAPYGYRRVRVADPDGKTDRDGKVVEYVTFEVVPEQAEVVRRVFTMYAEASSYKHIAHTFNDEGIVSPGGGTWDVSSVRTILLNQTYLGHRVWNQHRRNKKAQRGVKVAKPRDEWVVAKDAHEAIVTQEQWDAAERRRGRIRLEVENGRGGYNTAHSPYVLTGLLKCDECGANFVMSGKKRRGKRVRYYRCSYHANRGDAVCTNGRQIRQDTVERAVMELLSGQLLTADTVESVLEDVRVQLAEAADNQPQAVSEAERQISQVDREIANLTAAIKAGGPIDELVRELRDCKGRKAELQAETVRSTSFGPDALGEVNREDIEEALQDLKGTLSNRTPLEVKELLREHIREIRIPRNGSALLETRPEGLLDLLGSIVMVTPRGVEPPSPE